MNVLSQFTFSTEVEREPVYGGFRKENDVKKLIQWTEILIEFG